MEGVQWEGRVVEAVRRAFFLGHKQKRVHEFARHLLDGRLRVCQKEREGVQNAFGQVCSKVRRGEGAGDLICATFTRTINLISVPKVAAVQCYNYLAVTACLT